MQNLTDFIFNLIRTTTLNTFDNKYSFNSSFCYIWPSKCTFILKDVTRLTFHASQENTVPTMATVTTFRILIGGWPIGVTSDISPLITVMGSVSQDKITKTSSYQAPGKYYDKLYPNNWHYMQIVMHQLQTPPPSDIL